MNHTFLLLKGPDNVSYLARPYPEAYFFASNGEVLSSCYHRENTKKWWVSPFKYPYSFHLNEYGTKSRLQSKWWENETQNAKMNWEWDGGLIYSNLAKFEIIAETSGKINPDGIFYT